MKNLSSKIKSLLVKIIALIVIGAASIYKIPQYYKSKDFPNTIWAVLIFVFCFSIIIFIIKQQKKITK
jgi:exosortase/archaeosortase